MKSSGEFAKLARYVLYTSRNASVYQYIKTTTSHMFAFFIPINFVIANIILFSGVLGLIGK